MPMRHVAHCSAIRPFSRPRLHTYRTRAFSLLELLVVMAVTMILTGLLLPSLMMVRKNLHQVVCSSNLRQIGIGVSMFSNDKNENLPESEALTDDPKASHPRELMAAHIGVHRRNWDGLGHLWEWGYCESDECFYCPSHHGQHPMERYEGEWRYGPEDGKRIYTNYHYSGHKDWLDGTKRSLDEGRELILATDGLRTQGDFNHIEGMNILFGDISVQWSIHVDPVRKFVPFDDASPADDYLWLWDSLEKTHK